MSIIYPPQHQSPSCRTIKVPFVFCVKSAFQVMFPTQGNLLDDHRGIISNRYLLGCGRWLFGGSGEVIVEFAMGIINQPGIGSVFFGNMEMTRNSLPQGQETLLFSQTDQSIYIGGKAETRLLGKQGN